MVKGLAIFQEWFIGFEDQYVLIGGTAASISMAEAGLPFRGTSDLASHTDSNRRANFQPVSHLA